MAPLMPPNSLYQLLPCTLHLSASLKRAVELVLVEDLLLNGTGVISPGRGLNQPLHGGGQGVGRSSLCIALIKLLFAYRIWLRLIKNPAGIDILTAQVSDWEMVQLLLHCKQVSQAFFFPINSFTGRFLALRHRICGTLKCKRLSLNKINTHIKTSKLASIQFSA